MPVLGGLFRGQWDDDFGAIASRAAEQLGNTRAASQGQQTKVAAELAKRSPQTRQVTIAENPDGTLTHTTTVKNAPPKDPAQEVHEAGNEPYANFAHRVLTQGAEVGTSMLDDLQRTQGDIDQTLLTREGRVKVAKDLGVEDPHAIPGEFIRNGIFGFKKKVHDYESIINDPARLKSAILAKKFNEADKVGAALRPFNADVRSEAADVRAAKTQDRLNTVEDRQQDAEARRQHSAEMSQFNTVLDNIRSVDMTATKKTADEAVDAWRGVYGDEYATKLEPVIRSEWDRRRTERDLKDAKEKRDEAKDDRSRKEWDVRIRNLESMIGARDHKQNTQTVSRRDAIETPTNELLSYEGDEGYDQKSVARALKTKENTLRQERNKLTAAIAVASPTVNTMAKSEPWKKSEIAGMVAKIKDHQRRLAEIDADLALLNKTAPAATPSTTSGTGRTLSKEEALRKLKP